MQESTSIIQAKEIDGELYVPASAFNRVVGEYQQRIAMQDEALQSRRATDRYCAQYAHLPDAQDDIAQAFQDADELMDKAISASSEDVAAWQGKQLAPLHREVAMLRSVVRTMMFIGGEKTYPLNSDAQSALDNTQATAEAYDKEVAAKALEEAADWFEASPIIDAFWVRDVLKKMAAELIGEKL